MTFRMYPLGPWLLKILMFARLVTREIATYSWPWEYTEDDKYTPTLRTTIKDSSKSMHMWAKPKTLNTTSNFCFFLFASPNPNPIFAAYHICNPLTTSQNTLCICTYSLCWLQNISIFRHWLTLYFVEPCPHRDRDYRIGSNFWKLYLIRTGFTLNEPVLLMKVSVFHSFLAPSE
jgi:hypothetical protein